MLLLIPLGLSGCKSGGQPAADAGGAQVSASAQPGAEATATPPPPQEGAPQDAAGFVALGTELYKKDRDEEAAEAFKQAVSLDPEDGEAHRRLGLA